LNNANAPVAGKVPGDKKLRLSGPCYALIRGFERLTWFTDAMQINADGKAESVYVAYWPIVDGKRGEIIRATTMHIQANFFPLPDGGNELALRRTGSALRCRHLPVEGYQYRQKRLPV